MRLFPRVRFGPARRREPVRRSSRASPPSAALQHLPMPPLTRGERRGRVGPRRSSAMRAPVQVAARLLLSVLVAVALVVVPLTDRYPLLALLASPPGGLIVALGLVLTACGPSRPEPGASPAAGQMVTGDSPSPSPLVTGPRPSPSPRRSSRVAGWRKSSPHSQICPLRQRSRLLTINSACWRTLTASTR
jgi:hypothetical protein